MIYGYGACREKKSCLPSTFWRHAVLYGYGACREKIGIFLKINHIYLIKKEIQLCQCKINSKLPSSLFSNYINFKIIYFLNQNNASFFYFAISTQSKVPEDTISTHPTYVMSRVIFGAINDYASDFNFQSDHDDSKSMLGYIYILNGGAIC